MKSPAAANPAAPEAFLRLKRPFKGLVSAPFMPMLDDGAIDWESLESYLDWIAGQAPAAIAVNMDAAEAPALTPDEQVEVMRCAARAVGGRVPLISGLIGGSTAGMIAHGQRLADAGAEGFCVFPPLPVFIGEPIPPEMIRRFHADIGNAIGLPLIAFQLPRGWGPDYSGEMLAALASVPQVIAIKESSFDANQTIEAVKNVKALGNPIGILTGSDTFIYEALLMGCDGALIGFAGTGVSDLVAMEAAVRGGDVAAGWKVWERLGPVAKYCWRRPIRDFRPRMKEILRLQGQFKTSAVRLPQLGLGEAEAAELHRLAREAGLVQIDRQ